MGEMIYNLNVYLDFKLFKIGFQLVALKNT